MEPACAICSAPAETNCGCEDQRLKLAIEQSERRVIGAQMDELKEWVQTRSKERIFAFYQALKARRLAMHDQRLSDMHDQALYHGYVAMDPTLRAQEAGKLQHGLNEDWKSALLRYPDVLDHFYGQVRLDLPDDDDEELGGGPLVGEIQGLKGRLAQIRLGLGAGPGMGPGMGSGMGSGMGGPMLYREMDPGQQQQQQQQQLQQYPHPHPGHHHPPLPKGYLRTRPGPVYPPSMPPAPSSGPMPGAFPSNTIPPPAPQAPGWMPYPGY